MQSSAVCVLIGIAWRTRENLVSRAQAYAIKCKKTCPGIASVDPMGSIRNIGLGSRAGTQFRKAEICKVLQRCAGHPPSLYILIAKKSAHT